MLCIADVQVTHPTALHVVTGGTGTIGTSVVQALARQSVPYIITSRTPSLLPTPAIELDFASVASVRRAAHEILHVANGRKIVLVHVAGGVTTADRGQQWSNAPVFAANGLGPITLMELLKSSLLRIVAVSSVGVRFAASTKRITSGKPPTNVLQQYTTGKLAVDAYLQKKMGTQFFSIGLGATEGNFFRGRPHLPKAIMRLVAGRKAPVAESAGAILWAVQSQDRRSGLVTVTRSSDTPYQLSQLPNRAYDTVFQDWVVTQLSEFTGK